MKYIKFFEDINIHDINLVGGKNSSIGEMIKNLSSFGILVPDGFAITSEAYWYYLEYNNLLEKMRNIMSKLETPSDVKTLQSVGEQVRELILKGDFPEELSSEIVKAYHELSKRYKQENCDVAVRSSATAEDLPNASFAGQQETFLNVNGDISLLIAVKKCLASLFTDRAIIYRIENKFDHFKVALSVGIQKMVRSDLACSGVAFSLDTETGFKDVVEISSSYGLGDSIVQGIVNPDEFCVHKKTLELGFEPIIKKYLGNKETKIVYGKTQTTTVKVEKKDQARFSLSDQEILELSKFVIRIEDYYSKLRGAWSPMDVEWAKDGIDGKIYIVQARSETVHSLLRVDKLVRYHLAHPNQAKEVLVTGLSIGQKIAYGKVRVIKSAKEISKFETGDILVTGMTDPDWVPIMKKAAAIITDRGGRTCHAAIVSRELGIPAVIGTHTATEILKNGQSVTVDCSHGSLGQVYSGILPFEIDITELKSLPKPPVEVMMNIADPNRAFEASFLPVSGVGLARIEFIINSIIKVHPLAVLFPEKIKNKKTLEKINQLAVGYGSLQEFFVSSLAQGIATIAGAFYPKTVIVRLSDFKSNEYRGLIGGEYFEPDEENPMIGFRGAIRYCSEMYAPAFALECEAIKRAREVMGFKNIKVMVPFVRTVYEAQCALSALSQNGLDKEKNDLEVYMMCEVPSNVLLIDEFAKIFDGFSIGSNDLTQLTLGADRDSNLLGVTFNEQDPAVLKFLKMAIDGAKKSGKYIGICGQAPSDFPEFADFIIKAGIDSVSLNPDSVIPFLMRYK